MAPIPFAVYLHPEVAATSRPRETIAFVGQSLPYFDRVRAGLADAVATYPALPLARVDLALYRAVHDGAYLDAILRASQGDPDAPPLPVNAECTGLEHCLPGYELSLGGLVAAIDRMREGSLERAYCFSLGGHHAFPDRGHGYCLLNPLAAAARYAQRVGFQRVLILDWDIHHGDDTQAIFAGDASVYCVSVHSAVDLYMAKASRLALGTTTAAVEAGHWNIPVLDDRHRAHPHPRHLSFIAAPLRVASGAESMVVSRLLLGLEETQRVGDADEDAREGVEEEAVRVFEHIGQRRKVVRFEDIEVAVAVPVEEEGVPHVLARRVGAGEHACGRGLTMRITAIDPAPLHTLAYRSAAPGGGVLHASFPLYGATVDRLPAGCQALVVCSDLQGIVDVATPDGDVAPCLLGEALAEELALLAELGSIPPATAVGVLLCGDLYVRPALDARGGLGDVRPVWRAFARHFRWVAGVPGNHDAFGTPSERTAFANLPGTHLLDGAAAVLDGMRVAGLGGIIGASGKPNRRDERAFLRELRALLGGRPELLLLHQGPDVPALGLVGDPRIRQVLERADEMLVLCGHVHWKTILAELSPHVQVANLEGRGLVLRTAPAEAGCRSRLSTVRSSSLDSRCSRDPTGRACTSLANYLSTCSPRSSPPSPVASPRSIWPSVRMAGG